MVWKRVLDVKSSYYCISRLLVDYTMDSRMKRRTTLGIKVISRGHIHIVTSAWQGCSAALLLGMPFPVDRLRLLTL